MILISSCSRLCPIHWSQVLSWEWRCSWSSADRRCSNYIWVINNIIAYKGASYIRDLTVLQFIMSGAWITKFSCTTLTGNFDQYHDHSPTPKHRVANSKTLGAHGLEKCLNFNSSGWKEVLEFVIGLEKEQNALKSAWIFVKLLEKVKSQGLLPLNMIELHHYSEF